MVEQDPSAPALFEVGDLSPRSASFMDLEDPRYAYMFGFLQGDGSLSAGTGKKGRLSVEINIRDIAILREFQRLTPYNSSITERVRSTNFSERHHSAIWTMYALEARSTINRLGIPYGRKSAGIKPPRVEFSRRDYLRGAIDADGSVGYTREGFPFVSLTTGSAAVGAYLCFYAKRVTGAARQIKRNTRDRIYNVVYTKEAATKLAGHLYYPGCLSLDRKQIAADSLASWERPEGMRVRAPSRRWKPWEDQILLSRGNNASSAAELGRTGASCGARLWRLKTGQVNRPAETPPEP